MTTIARDDEVLVTIGVDTHLDTHTAVAVDNLGRRLASTQIAATPDGYDDLIAWASTLGEVEAFGIEGTSSYGAGLTRHLGSLGFLVLEVTRPNRQKRRHKGKSDPVDAEMAARAVLAGEDIGIPKSGVAEAEMTRVLRTARATAMKARTQAINALRALVITAPAELREELRHLPARQLVERASRLRPGDITNTTSASKHAIRSLGRRYQNLTAEISELDEQLDELVKKAAPTLTSLYCVGTDSAGQLLVTAGDNPHRLRSDAAFSMLCASSPQPAGSGKTNNRHRLNRGGDRQANAALYRIVLVRMRWDPRTKDYVARRTKEGKTKPEIIRCLKRYVAREVFAALQTDLARLQQAP